MGSEHIRYQLAERAYARHNAMRRLRLIVLCTWIASGAFWAGVGVASATRCEVYTRTGWQASVVGNRDLLRR